MKSFNKTIKNLLKLKPKERDIAKKALDAGLLPIAEASYVEKPIPKEEAAIEVKTTVIKDRQTTAKELSASMGNAGKMSAAHITISEELITAKENYKNSPTSATRDELIQALVNQATPIIEEIVSLKKGLEASNQICPNLDKYMGVVKSQLCINTAGTNTLLLGSAMIRLNEAEKVAKANISTPSISKHELDTRINNLLGKTGLIKEEIQIFDKSKYNALKSIPKTLSTVEFDESSDTSVRATRPRSASLSKAQSPNH